MKKVLITGISGFAGSFLAENLLKNENVSIAGTYISPDLSNLSGIKENMSLFKVDLTEYDLVESIIKETQPDVIFHLAALTSPAQSFRDSTHTVLGNIEMEMNILNSVVSLKMDSIRLILISSAEVYGMVESSDLPIDESTLMRPSNPYAVSKIAQDFLGLQYFLSHKVDTVRIRPFNHAGPRQAPFFVISSFAKQIAEIEKGTMSAEIKVGNLSAKRDFTDVRDMVIAYEQLSLKGQSGEVYNAGSGTSYKIEDILQKLLALSTKEIKVVEDPIRLLPTDIPELRCDYSKLQSCTGWKPEINMDQTLSDTLEYWRNIVSDK